MRPSLIEAVEGLTERTVVTFMSANDTEPTVTPPPRSSCSTAPSDRSAAQASSPEQQGRGIVRRPRTGVAATVGESSSHSSSPVSTSASPPPTKGSPASSSTNGAGDVSATGAGACRLSPGAPAAADRDACRRPRAPALAASQPRGLSAHVAAAFCVRGARCRAAALSRPGTRSRRRPSARAPLPTSTPAAGTAGRRRRAAARAGSQRPCQAAREVDACDRLVPERESCAQTP